MTHPQNRCFLLPVPLTVCLWALSPVVWLAQLLWQADWWEPWWPVKACHCLFYTYTCKQNTSI